MSDTASNGGPPPNLPAPPAVPTGGWGGHLVPAQVAGRILSLIVDRAAFASSLTRWATNSNQVVFPVASPEGAAWVDELQRIPLMNLNDQPVIVAVAKLAGLVDISNEMVSDSFINITAEVGRLLGDSMSLQLDDGLLNGSGPPEPAGVLAVADSVEGGTLLEAAATAVGQIGNSGGVPNVLAANPATLAAENTRLTDDGHLLYQAGGIGAVLGLNAVAVPELQVPLVYDAGGMFLILNGQQSTVEFSTDYRFAYDATSIRVKSRVAIGCPVPGKTIRKLDVGE